MYSDTISIPQVIQLILAPAVMINATGLLLLTVSNKYSLILNRLRNLNEERRRLMGRAGEPDFTTRENQRMESIQRQLSRLAQRARFIRNANACYFSAIGIFVAVSLSLGLDLSFPLVDLQPVLLVIFLIGMCLDLAGVVYSWLDTFKAYEVVKYEVAADE